MPISGLNGAHSHMNSSPQDLQILEWKTLILCSEQHRRLCNLYKRIPLVFRPGCNYFDSSFQYFNFPSSLFYENVDLEGVASAVRVIPGLTAVVDFVMFDRS